MLFQLGRLFHTLHLFDLIPLFDRFAPAVKLRFAQHQIHVVGLPLRKKQWQKRLDKRNLFYLDSLAISAKEVESGCK